MSANFFKVRISMCRIAIIKQLLVRCYDIKMVGLLTILMIVSLLQANKIKNGASLNLSDRSLSVFYSDHNLNCGLNCPYF